MKVLVELKEGSGKGYTYEVPPELEDQIQLGTRVAVNVRDHEKHGTVISLEGQYAGDCKPILRVGD